jgi:hypothetical protein
VVTYCPLRFDFSGSTKLALADQDGPSYGAMEEEKMNVAIWLPATLAMGLAGLGLCFAFISACEKI